jgi:hypothetical protein
MRPFLIVALDPGIEVSREFDGRSIDLLAQGYARKSSSTVLWNCSTMLQRHPDGALNLFLKETEFRVNCGTASALLRTLKRWAKSELSLPIRGGPKF